MTSVADAPSDSCDELPAVTLPRPLAASNTGGSFAQAVERRVGPIALVAIDQRWLLADLLAGLLVEDRACHLDRRELAVEEALPPAPARCAAG